MFVFILVCITLCPSSFDIIILKKRERVALPLMSYRCLVTVNVLWLSSQCCKLVCSVRLWYFLIILTFN